MTFPTEPYTSDGFLLDEERALRDHLIGMTVFDLADTSGKSVGIWFSHPDREVRDQKYPYGVITLIGINEATERMMAGRTALSIIPDGLPTPIGDIVYGDYPVPVNLDYQIQFYSRNPRHSRSIMSQALNTYLPMRAGHLTVGDGTYRRMDMLGVAHRESDEGDKRLFVSTYTVRISSEMTPANLEYRAQYAVTTPIVTVAVGLTQSSSSSVVTDSYVDLYADTYA
jgi:hypothetical protein